VEKGGGSEGAYGAGVCGKCSEVKLCVIRVPVRGTPRSNAACLSSSCTRGSASSVRYRRSPQALNHLKCE